LFIDNTLTISLTISGWNEPFNWYSKKQIGHECALVFKNIKNQVAITFYIAHINES
jgi:hypothetical protein